MSDVLTVHTHFEDISELAQGLADRVDENQIILYGPESYEEGAELGFQVLLADGTPGLEGSGFVTATYDGGEDRDPDTRYDVVIAGLRLEGMSEVVFERLMVARASLVGDEPPSTEMAVPEGLAEAVAAEEVAEVADVAEPVEEAVEAVAAEEVAEVEEAAPAPIEAMFDDEATTVASAADFLAEEAEPEPEPVAAEEVAEVAEPEPVAAAPVEPPAPAPVAAPAPAPVSAPEPVAAAAPAARPQAREIPAAVEVAPIAGGGRNVGATGEGFRGVPPPNAPPVPPVSRSRRTSTPTSSPARRSLRRGSPRRGRRSPRGRPTVSSNTAVRFPSRTSRRGRSSRRPSASRRRPRRPRRTRTATSAPRSASPSRRPPPSRRLRWLRRRLPRRWRPWSTSAWPRPRPTTSPTT